MKSKDLTEDSRTIYSLAMILILYEAYKSEFLLSENFLILIIKLGLLILISTQLIFLYLCGLSYANFNGDYKEKLIGMASDFYRIGFQISFPIFLLDILFGFVYYYLRDTAILFTLWGKLLFVIFNFFIAYETIHIRKKFFMPKLERNDYIYFIIFLWLFISTIFIITADSTHHL